MSGDDRGQAPFSFGGDPQGAARAGTRTMPGWLKLVLVVVVLAGGAGGYLYFVDPRLGRELLGGTPMAPPPAVTTAYKWRDAKGNWHLTDRPPPQGTPYETVEAHGDANIMPSQRLKKE